MHKWDEGELIAIKYLQRKGYKVLDTNFKFSRFWEIDIICKKENITIFIEVKYRTNDKYGTPEESITKNKLRKAKRTIEYYIVKHENNFEDIRFDVVSIVRETKSYKLKHYKNIQVEF